MVTSRRKAAELRIADLDYWELHGGVRMKQVIIPDVLTLEEVAAYLRIPKETIQRQAARGRIPGRQIDDTWRFLKVAIDDWLRSRNSRTILLHQASALLN